MNYRLFRQSMLPYLYHYTYQNRNNSWKPYCVVSFNMGWRILVFYPERFSHPNRRTDCNLKYPIINIQCTVIHGENGPTNEIWRISPQIGEIDRLPWVINERTFYPFFFNIRWNWFPVSDLHSVKYCEFVRSEMSKRGNKNDSRSVEEEDDDDEVIPEEYLHNTQDNSERLRIRKGYRTLIEDLHSWSFLFIFFIFHIIIHTCVFVNFVFVIHILGYM